MKFFFKLGLSPLGPYQYNMIVNSFSGTTDRIREEFNWKPTKITMKCFYLHIITMLKIIMQFIKIFFKGQGNGNIGREGIIKILKWLS
ncbi:MAG: hypothetical protein CM15mP93_16730 [Thiotrichaceae bacterium]|nr:MAG: hypothetical protein CM15mP93_16730 [Thiotrichaceae bacterium]